MKFLLKNLAGLLLIASFSTQAADEAVQASSLSELLNMVKEGKVVNGRINERREKEFLADKSRQNQALRSARRQQANEEARSERLEAQFEKMSRI